MTEPDAGPRGAEEESPDSAFPTWLTPWSLAALAAGFALGAAGNATGSRTIAGLAAALDPVGAAWMTALRFAVVPLVVLQVMVPILRTGADRGLGGLLARALGLFALLLLGGALLAAVVNPLVVALYTPPPGTMEAIRGSIDPDLMGNLAGGDPDGGRSVLGLVLAVLSGRHVLPLILGAMAGAFVVRHAGASVREPVARVVEALLRRVMRVVLWVLYATPVGVFVIALAMALEAGLDAAGVAVALVVMWSGVVLAFTLPLYPLTALLSGLSMRRLAEGAAPAQLVAAGTRSSVASLPALVEGAEDILRLPRRVSGLVLPLSVSVFKYSEPIQNHFRLVFMASVFGVSLSVLDVAAFLTLVLVTSVGVAGLPSGGGMRNLPAYLSAGIPIEGALLTEALEAIPDIFMTIANVTADMCVAVVLSARWSGAVDVDAPPWIGRGRRQEPALSTRSRME